MYFLAPLAVLFNIVLTWLFFRNWKETLIALVPLLTGVVWLLGIMSLFDMPLNVVNIVAGMIASGVIVDYGLGITYEYRHNLHFGTVMAMTLSAASNVIGAGALLFARHPALYSTGVAMVICMVVGYLSSVLVGSFVLQHPGTGSGRKGVMKRLLAAVLVALSCRVRAACRSRKRRSFRLSDADPQAVVERFRSGHAR